MTASSAKRNLPDDDAQPDSSSHSADRRSRGKGSRTQQQQPLSAFFRTKPSKSAGKADIGKASSNASGEVQWREIGGTWIGKWGSPAPAPKLATFDLDGTLICVKGKGRFPKDSDDWRFFHPEVPQVLRRMHQQGYRIVIISNQNGLRPSKGVTGLSKRAMEFRLKISKISSQLNVPFTILVATLKDYMRKPSPGMWHLAQQENDDLAIGTTGSFFVGDAAGRLAGWKRGAVADFSDSDLAFALNAGVPFYTPEEVFTEEICSKAEPLPLAPQQNWSINRFSPRELAEPGNAHKELMGAIKKQVEKAAAAKVGLLVMLVGPPACGKSTFAVNDLEPLGFLRVNMDELKTRKRCEDAVRHALKTNACVVIDNTNPDTAARSAFVRIAGEHGASCIAVVFEHGSRDLAIHNNNYRAQLVQARHFSRLGRNSQTQRGAVPDCSDRVPDVAYHSYFKRFVLPESSEGFSIVLHHSFVPRFSSEEDKQLWNQYY
ncbi:DNA kinase/phosphatase Pnk1 [Coemansia guatemalensis]|uniref:DNA kinase/phosphatase Pnk1 n=1 Tax=Coemansia guatemalensis TaxID=2761395 RepID=A0A9W8LV31_9FUNG|nr:DNA kinase/phosphatase Pnk1 [Coemansia guatemalensis]